MLCVLLILASFDAEHQIEPKLSQGKLILAAFGLSFCRLVIFWCGAKISNF